MDTLEAYEQSYYFLSRLAYASTDVSYEGEADALSLMVMQSLVPSRGYRVRSQDKTLLIPVRDHAKMDGTVHYEYFIKSVPDRSVNFIKSGDGVAYMVCIVEGAAVKFSSSSKELKEFQLPGLL